MVGMSDQVKSMSRKRTFGLQLVTWSSNVCAAFLRQATAFVAVDVSTRYGDGGGDGVFIGR